MASERQVLTFRTRAWLSFAPCTCRMPLGQASGFSRADPGGRVTPRFRHRLIRFRHFIDGSLALASLNLACRDHVPTFPQRSPPSLLTTAARGGLRPAPDCRPRRALLHLSYSSAPLHADGAFVTHAPNRLFASTNLATKFPGMPGAFHMDKSRLRARDRLRRLRASGGALFAFWQRRGLSGTIAFVVKANAKKVDESG